MWPLCFNSVEMMRGERVGVGGSGFGVLDVGFRARCRRGRRRRRRVVSVVVVFKSVEVVRG